MWWRVDREPAGADAYPAGIVLRDRAGKVIRVALGPGDVDCRPYYTASPDDWVVKALVAAEDGTFWTHRGVRPSSVLRAAWQNLVSGRRISGASTLTMQAVRLIEPHPKSLWWKFVEAVRAVRLEREHDKCWILSQYLNRAPFGSNFVGVEAAAQGWFGKGAKELGPGEGALLAAMVQAPSRLRPDRARERVLKRRAWVLGRMEKLGFLTAEQRAGVDSTWPEIRRAPRPFRHPHFCDRALQACGRTGDFVTTLDADVQSAALDTVRAAAAAGGWSCAAVVLDVPTGDVRALACSGDYFDSAGGQVNTACAPRPAGSTLKPFLTALALDRGLVTSGLRLNDAPKTYAGYAPANFDGRFRGPVTLRDALVLSLNLPFVDLLHRLGVPAFAGALRDLGFAHLGDEARLGLGLAIGNGETTLLELANAYAALARGGTYLPARFLRAEPAAAPVRRFSPAAAYWVADILSGSERAAAARGHVADVSGARFAWKTGTSAACRDAWTVLWNPACVVAVWCGHLRGGFDDPTLVGAKAAAPVAWRLARALYPQNDGPWYAPPPDAVRRRVCAVTGLLATADCPETEEDGAVAGRSSLEMCRLHRPDGPAAAARTLAFLKPEDGSAFHYLPDFAQQGIACRISGARETETVWWFADGEPAGETRGTAPFAWSPRPGKHVLSCATADGLSAAVRVTVTE